MRRIRFARWRFLGIGLTVVLGSCVDRPMPNASMYVQQDLTQQIPLAFQVNSAVPTPGSIATLSALRSELPALSSLSLVGSTTTTEARAQQVGAELHRFVSVATEPTAGTADVAMLQVTTRRLVATDCLAPGQPVPRDNWPGDDTFRQRSMPPGCAVANAIQQMAVSKEDLQRGRPLPPGAALPVGRAIERYYSRTETAVPTTAQAASGLGAGSAAPVSLPASTGTAASDAGTDLLQGPLTPQPTTPATADPAKTAQ